MARSRLDDDEIKTRLPRKGRTQQRIRNKFKEIEFIGLQEEDEELEDLYIPEKINGKRRK